jgi:cytochrome c-type biogenesis protein CcmF
MVFLVPTLPLLALVGIGMHAGWRRSALGGKRRTLALIAGGALLVSMLVTLVFYGGFGLPLTVVGFTGALFVMGSALIDPISRWRNKQGISRAALGMAVAHFGVGVFVIGISGVASYKIEKDVSMSPGDSAEIAGYRFNFIGTENVRGPNYDALEARVKITRAGAPVADLTTQKRKFKIQAMPMAHAGIAVAWNRDLFVALGDELGAGKWSMRLQYKPLVRYIWIGAVIVALGGLIATLDRRYRVPRTADALLPADAATDKVS